VNVRALKGDIQVRYVGNAERPGQPLIQLAPPRVNRGFVGQSDQPATWVGGECERVILLMGVATTDEEYTVTP
jgi:hypothetical protein